LALNPVHKIDVVANDLLAGITLKADLILANILAEVLVPLIPQLDSALAPHGQVLLSGIYYDKVDTIKTDLTAAGFTIVGVNTLGDWAAIIAQRAADEDDDA